MKCPYCSKRPNMIRKTIGRDNWWECPECHKTIGKKESLPPEPEPEDDTEIREKAEAYDILMGENDGTL